MDPRELRDLVLFQKPVTADVVTEAADEIERLRRLVTDLAIHLRVTGLGHCICDGKGICWDCGSRAALAQAVEMDLISPEEAVHG